MIPSVAITNALGADVLADYNVTYVTNTAGEITPATVPTTLDLVASNSGTNGYRDSVDFTATVKTNGVTATAVTGSVVFSYTNYATTANAPFSTNALVLGTTSSLSITNLPRGTNLIIATYAGDPNYDGSTNTLEQVVTNHPAVASPMTVTRTAGLDLQIRVSDLATNWSDVDADTISLTNLDQSTNFVNLFKLTWAGSAWTNGVSSTNAFIGYTNTPGSSAANDTFTYTITDGYDATTGTVYVIANSTPLFGQLQTNGITVWTAAGPLNGHFVLTFGGVEGYNYEIQSAPDVVAGPWNHYGYFNPTAGNVVTNLDLGTSLSGDGYYRLMWLPPP